MHNYISSTYMSQVITILSKLRRDNGQTRFECSLVKEGQQLHNTVSIVYTIHNQAINLCNQYV